MHTAGACLEYHLVLVIKCDNPICRLYLSFQLIRFIYLLHLIVSQFINNVLIDKEIFINKDKLP